MMTRNTTLTAMLALSLVSSVASAQHHGHCETAPVMQTGDFDGNGVVDNADKAMLLAYMNAGKYAAFFDMNADGKLTGLDVAAVAKNKGMAGSPRDAQMAALWANTQPYVDQSAAYAAGYVPFTPDLKGHGIHWANFGLINSWASHGFQAAQPEGLNYTADGELIAAFYYAPAAIDLYDYGYAPVPDTYFQALHVPPSFDGVGHHAWHNHVGACFAGASCPVPGFDQCMTEAACAAIGGQLWSAKFHMLHVWLYEFNECGPFAGIDEDVSVSAPHEPNHGDCNIQDVVPVVVNDPTPPMGFVPNACYDE